MATRKRSRTGAAARLAGDTRALQSELKKAEAALRKARALIAKLEKALAAAKPRVTRYSRDL